MTQKFYFWAELQPGASNRCLYTDIHNSFIHNSQKVETTQMFIDRWIYKQNVAFLYKEILALFSHVWFFVTPWTVAHQGPLSMGFSRQEYWSGLPCRPPGGSSQPRDGTHVCYICCTGKHVFFFFTTSATKWNKPVTKGQILVWFHLHGTPRIAKVTEKESSIVIICGWGGGEMESYCLMGTEFQLGLMKKFWRWMVVMIVQ